MPRYFTRAAKPRALWIEDDHDMPDMRHDPLPEVSEHVAVDTGLLDARGETIMRAPDAIGFGRREGWVD